MKMAALWVVAPCSQVEVYQNFTDVCCLHHQGDDIHASMTEAAMVSGNFVNVYLISWRCDLNSVHFTDFVLIAESK
jgi:hypothetical protein